MKIPIDLTPYEFILGVSSSQRNLDNKYYEIPDEIYSKMQDELQETINEITLRIQRKDG